MSTSSDDAPLEIALVGELSQHENDLCDKLLAVPPGGPCILYFNSPGGSAYAALSLATFIAVRGLVATGIVTRDAIEQAAEEALQASRPIGQILVEKGFINENDLYSMLATQHEMSFSREADLLRDADPSLARAIPRRFLEKYRVIPITFKDSTLVVASSEGRLDHLLGSLLLLGADRYSALELDALVGDALVQVVRRERRLEGCVGELLTLVPLGGPVTGVTTQGLEYPLAGETLEPGTTRGVSNVFVAEAATVRVGAGTLLAIRPGPAKGGVT